MPARIRLTFRAAVAALAGLLTAALVATTAPAAHASGMPSISRAVAYAHARHVRIGIAVEDLRSRRVYTGGDTHTFSSASVVKVLVATRMLLAGRMSGRDARRAYEMIIGSNDNDCGYLWNKYGGPSIISYLERHYRVNIGAPNWRPGKWGNTQLYASGLARFYAAVRTDRHVWPWLGNAMAHTKRYGDDGTNQYFGIPAAGGGHQVKQGWGQGHGRFSYNNNAVINSTGIVTNGARQYAVVILAEGVDYAPSSNRDAYNARLAAIVTAAASDLMPHGRIRLP